MNLVHGSIRILVELMFIFNAREARTKLEVKFTSILELIWKRALVLDMLRGAKRSQGGQIQFWCLKDIR